MKSTPLSFSPAPPCVACKQLTTEGHIYTMNPLVWQLVPLCNEHSEEPEAVGEAWEEQFVSIRDLQGRITNDLQTIQQLRRKQQHVARAFLRLHNQNGHTKAKRALRRKLCRLCLRQAEAVEVWRE
jgi:hypothetical protein